MEILNTTEHVLEYWGYILVAGLMLLLFGSLMCVGLSKLIKEKDYREDLGATIACTVISLMLVTTLAMLIRQDVRITHDVIITNWDEVHDQGYKVLEQKGQIVTVEEER